MLIRRLLTYVADKDARTTDKLRDWRHNLQNFRSMQTASGASVAGRFGVQDKEDDAWVSDLDDHELGPYQALDEENASGMATEDHGLDDETSADDAAT